MAIALSQPDYCSLFSETEPSDPQIDSFDVTRSYPALLGQGYFREIHLRDGLELAIANYQLHQDLIVEVPEREHPLEYEFTVVREHPHQQTCFSSEHYFFSGSGLADSSMCEWSAGWQVLEVSFHLEPELFCTWMGDRLEQTSTPMRKLVKAPNQARYTHDSTPTVAMQAALQQILHCPYTGITQQIYLESKIWELMALHLEQMLQESPNDTPSRVLKSEDIDRIQYAKEILAQRLNDPPSLNALARQVGLNEFTLKQGFRKVFGTTVLGCLQHYRMERARELLANGNLNVTEVAREVGFANRGYFAATFRKKFGVNPKAYSLVAAQDAG
jgi:AraC-like DNA-binding protein